MQVYWDVHIVYEVSNKVKWMKATDTEMENLTWYPIDGKTRSLWNLTFKENKGQDKMNISSLFLIDEIMTEIIKYEHALTIYILET